MKVTLPQMYQKQYDAFFNDARIAICEASTKAGKTVGALGWQANKVLGDRLALNHWWTAPFHPVANIAYSRAKRMFRGVYEKSNDSDKCLTFRNSARWWFKSAEKPDSLYGEDVGSAVMDEFTRMRVEAYYALVSTLTATEGQLRGIGNVKGRGWGYQLARRAEAREPGLLYTKITADDAVAAGVLSQETVDHARRTLPHPVFRELYFCEPSDDGGNPFGMANIDACIREASDGETVAYGVDLAKSVDYTVLTGLDADLCHTRTERWQKMDWGQQIDKLAHIIKDTPALIDSTGVGDPIVEELQRRCPNIEGFKFNTNSKQQLMEGLSSAIHQQRVGIPDGDWANELRCFEYEHTRTGVRYSAPDGLHDDCVCSLALAVKAVADMPQCQPSIISLKREPMSLEQRIQDFMLGDDEPSTSIFHR